LRQQHAGEYGDQPRQPEEHPAFIEERLHLDATHPDLQRAHAFAAAPARQRRADDPGILIAPALRCGFGRSRDAHRFTDERQLIGKEHHAIGIHQRDVGQRLRAALFGEGLQLAPVHGICRGEHLIQ